MVNRQRTGFDEVCAGVGEGGEVLGVRVFGDCDHVTVNGRTLECSGVSTSSGAVSRTLTLQVEESISKFIMLHHNFSVTPQFQVV